MMELLKHLAADLDNPMTLAAHFGLYLQSMMGLMMELLKFNGWREDRGDNKSCLMFLYVDNVG